MGNFSAWNDGWSVYALEGPRDGRVYYVGVTHCIEERFRNTLYEAKRVGKAKYRATDRDRWVASLLAIGLRPTIRVLKTGKGRPEAEAAEQKWIAHYRDKGEPMLNICKGGVGGYGMPWSEKMREIMPERIKAAHKTRRNNSRDRAGVKHVLSLKTTSEAIEVCCRRFCAVLFGDVDEMRVLRTKRNMKPKRISAL